MKSHSHRLIAVLTCFLTVFFNRSSHYSMGSRAFSHDSIFIPDGRTESEQAIQAMSQENVLGKVKILQVRNFKWKKYLNMVGNSLQNMLNLHKDGLLFQ